MMFFDPKQKYEQTKRNNFLELVKTHPSLDESIANIDNQIHNWKKKYNEKKLNDSPFVALYSFNVAYNIKYDFENPEYIQEYYKLIEQTTKKDFRNYDFIDSFYEKIIKNNLVVAFEETDDFIKSTNYILKLTDISNEELTLLLDNS